MNYNTLSYSSILLLKLVTKNKVKIRLIYTVKICFNMSRLMILINLFLKQQL